MSNLSRHVLYTASNIDVPPAGVSRPMLAARRVGVARPVLQQVHLGIEGHDQPAIVAALQNGPLECRGGRHQEREPVADALTAIDEHRDADRRVDLTAEVGHRLRHAIVVHRDVVAAQRRDEPALRSR